MQVSWFSIAAVVISLVALLVTFRNYLRKAGVLIRGSFSVASSRSCNDTYVSDVTLENMKDRAITIYAIYLQVGYSYCIELETFDEQPIILKPYETYHKKFGPIEFYAVSYNKVDLNAVFQDKKVRKRLVLSTGDGRYVVPSFIPRWNPVVEMFRNSFFGVVHPIQSRYKDQFLGSSIRFVIEFKGGSNTEIVPIHPRDFELKIFRSFQLTQESLANRETLLEYLEGKRAEGSLSCDEISVHDVDAWRVNAHEFYTGRTIVGQKYSWLTYHVVGRGIFRYKGYKLRQSNRKLRREQKREHERRGS